MFSKFKHRISKKRKGVAAVEFAVALPPILLVVLGTIETSRALSVQHTLQEASMSGCRIYMLRDKSQADATNVIAQSLAAANITGYSVTFDPPTKAEIDSEMEPVTVSISVPYANVGLGIEWFMTSSSINASSVLPADFLDEPPEEDD